MDKELNILSIDFDFFQIVDVDTIRYYYPDGLDLPSELSSLVWNSRYSIPQYRKVLEKVQVDKNHLAELKLLLDTSFSQKKVDCLSISQSHKRAFGFIQNVLEKYPDTGKVNIVNIDLHHDIENGNPLLDCGNWVSFLLKWLNKMHINRTFKWIAKPVSFEGYGLDEQDKQLSEFFVNADFSSLTGIVWDAIFLCRSDNWLPPHLDADFTEFASYLKDHATSTTSDPALKERKIKYM